MLGRLKRSLWTFIRGKNMRRALEVLTLGFAAVVVLAACSSGGSDAAATAAPEGSAQASAVSGSVPAATPSVPQSTAPSAASPSPEPSAVDVPAFTEDSLFDVMPTKQDAEKWGLRKLQDFVNNGENVNQVAAFDSVDGALAFMLSDGEWTKVKPASCAPVQALAYPTLDSDAVVAGVSAFTDSPALGPGFAENMAFVQVTTWPTAEDAQARFDAAAAVASDCGTYTVKQADHSYSASRWDGAPEVTGNSIVGHNSQGLGTAMGVVGTATYSVVVVNKQAAKVVSKANGWVQDSLAAAQAG